mmetsp:Transcript_19974/g.49044  ORF Transcript_19974/g.49044 Transcript_19974/m.49044 type:complete len:200 (-) Transcript_19974:538-1137(-)
MPLTRSRGRGGPSRPLARRSSKASTRRRASCLARESPSIPPPGAPSSWAGLRLRRRHTRPPIPSGHAPPSAPTASTRPAPPGTRAPSSLLSLSPPRPLRAPLLYARSSSASGRPAPPPSNRVTDAPSISRGRQRFATRSMACGRSPLAATRPSPSTLSRRPVPARTLCAGRSTWSGRSEAACTCVCAWGGVCVYVRRCP